MVRFRSISLENSCDERADLLFARTGGGLHYIGALGIMGLTFATAGEMIHHSLSPEGKSSWI